MQSWCLSLFNLFNVSCKEFESDSFPLAKLETDDEDYMHIVIAPKVAVTTICLLWTGYSKKHFTWIKFAIYFCSPIRYMVSLQRKKLRISKVNQLIEGHQANGYSSTDSFGNESHVAFKYSNLVLGWRNVTFDLHEKNLKSEQEMDFTRIIRNIRASTWNRINIRHWVKETTKTKTKYFCS